MAEPRKTVYYRNPKLKTKHIYFGKLFFAILKKLVAKTTRAHLLPPTIMHFFAETSRSKWESAAVLVMTAEAEVDVKLLTDYTTRPPLARSTDTAVETSAASRRSSLKNEVCRSINVSQAQRTTSFARNTTLILLSRTLSLQYPHRLPQPRSKQPESSRQDRVSV